MASVASQLMEEVTAHAQSDSLEDARKICADGTYFQNSLRASEFEISGIRRSSATHPFTSIHVPELNFFDQIYNQCSMQFLFLSELFWQNIKDFNENKPRRKGKGKDFSVRPTKACRGRRSVTPLILNLGTRLRWVVNYTLRPLCPLRETLYTLNGKLDGPQSRSERFQ